MRERGRGGEINTCIMKGTKVQTLGARAVAGAWCMHGWLLVAVTGGIAWGAEREGKIIIMAQFGPWVQLHAHR